MKKITIKDFIYMYYTKPLKPVFKNITFKNGIINYLKENNYNQF